MEVISAAIPLLLKSLWLTAKWAGIARVKALKFVLNHGGQTAAEVIFLRDRVDGARPEDLFSGVGSPQPSRDAKTVPSKIECRAFKETRVTGYRLKMAA